MVREYKKKRTKAYIPEDLLNVVKGDTLTLKPAHQEYKIPLGTLFNQVKSKAKVFKFQVSSLFNHTQKYAGRTQRKDHQVI